MQTEPTDTKIEYQTVKTDMTFGDGFRFGCGFMAAVVVFWIILVILSGLMAGVAFLIAPQLTNLLPH